MGVGKNLSDAAADRQSCTLLWFRGSIAVNGQWASGIGEGVIEFHEFDYDLKMRGSDGLWLGFIWIICGSRAAAAAARV